MSCKISEAEIHWRDFLTSLIERGLHGLQLIISDNHAGLRKARQAVFPTVTWQRCVFHLLSNALDHVSKKALRGEIAQDLKNIFNASDLDQAKELKQRFLKKYQKKQSGLCEWADTNLDEGMEFYNHPQVHWKRIKTTNMLERFNRELKRRTKVVSIFPNEQSAFRLVGALLMEQHEEWFSERRYLQREEN